MKTDGYPAIAQGAVTTGLVYLIVAFIIKKIGSSWLDKILPPIVVGPVIMVIGLGLAANAATNAMYNQGKYDFKYIAVALITLALTIFFNMWLKGFLGLIPILLESFADISLLYYSVSSTRNQSLMLHGLLYRTSKYHLSNMNRNFI